MFRKTKQRSGMTLGEVVVSVAIIAAMIAVTIPAVEILRESFHSSGAKTMISSALSAARALAAKHQRYAGIRFQFDPNGREQYMIFILHDPQNLSSVNGFRAIEGLKPMKLPEDQGIMDLYVAGQPLDVAGDPDSVMADPNNVTDTTTFSIIFSPSGKLIIHDVRVLHFSNNDKIFNDLGSVNALFDEDTNNIMPYKLELSRGSFVIYDKKEFSKIDSTRRWTDYLCRLQVLYLNPYTGTIIE